MRMKKMSALLAVPFLAFSLAACGGDDNVSKEQFVDGFVKESAKELPEADSEILKEVGGCIYDEVDHQLSTDALKAVAAGNSKDIESIDDTSALKVAFTECVDKMEEELSSTD